MSSVFVLSGILVSLIFNIVKYDTFFHYESHEDSVCVRVKPPILFLFHGQMKRFDI